MFFVLEKAYNLFYKFNPQEYNKYQFETYQIKKEIKLGNQVKIQTIHLHNIARLLNSLYGTIFLIKFES